METSSHLYTFNDMNTLNLGGKTSLLVCANKITLSPSLRSVAAKCDKCANAMDI